MFTLVSDSIFFLDSIQISSSNSWVDSALDSKTFQESWVKIAQDSNICFESKVDSNQLLTQVMFIQLNSRSNINDNHVDKSVYIMYISCSTAFLKQKVYLVSQRSHMYHIASVSHATYCDSWLNWVTSNWIDSTLTQADFWKHVFESAHDST